MTSFTSEKITCNPCFDMELFMNVSQETRIGGEIMDRLIVIWAEWLPHLTVKKLTTGEIHYLLVWMRESVETKVDALWSDSPSTSYMYNALAQTLCMAAVHEVIPQIADIGCAPAPKPTASLRAALQTEGIPYRNENDPVLSRRYAVLTHYPFKGGCELCILQQACPRGQGQARAASIVLPGYERN